MTPHWFLHTLTAIHPTCWIAKASSTGDNPLVAYSCHGEGRTIAAAIRALRHNIATGYNLVPPPESLPTEASTAATLNLLNLLGLDKPKPPTQTVRRV